MGKLIRSLLLVIFLAASLFSYSQADSTPPIKWSVTSKKLEEKKFELTFTTPELPNVKFYAPGQNLDSLFPSAQIIFTDSSVTADSITTTASIQFWSTPLFANDTIKLLNGPVNWKVIVHFKDIIPKNLLGSLVYFYNWDGGLKADPPFEFSVPMEGGVVTGGKIKIASIDIDHPVSNCGDEGTENKSLLTIFFLGFLGGLIALLTPCVFPMIPVTVTFFTKKSEDRKKGIMNATLYGLFIFLIYVAITIPFHIAGNTRGLPLNTISVGILIASLGWFWEYRCQPLWIFAVRCIS